jgi:hypothetical protein
MSGQSGAAIVISSQKDSLQNRIINDPSTKVTFWQPVVRPHSLFAVSSQKIEVQNANFGTSPFVLIPRSAPLLYKMHLEIQLPALTGTNVAWTHYPGLALIRSVQIRIGSQEFDKQYAESMYIWAELTMTTEKKKLFDYLVGQRDALITPGSSIPAATLKVPLMFWFCRNPGLALPLAAISQSEVRINM